MCMHTFLVVTKLLFCTLQVCSHVRNACDSGATVVVGGDVASDVGKWFYQPTVLTDVKQNMLVSCEETFGPVAAITRCVCVCVCMHVNQR